MAWGIVANAAVGLIVSDRQSKAASQANQQQQDGTNAAVNENRRQFDINQGNQQPYLDAGKKALGDLQLGIDTPLSGADAMAEPGYQFGLKQGQLGIDRKASAMGGRYSGAALKAASQYNTDYASGQYDKVYQRRQDRLNRLAALAGVGQTATQQVGSVGQATASRVGSLYSGQGDANAAATIAQGNIWSGAINKLGGAGISWMQQ